MRDVSCAREADVLEAVSMDRWPDCGDPDLVAHASACALCADVIEVARALQDDRRTACQRATVPTSGIIWWRAEMRARNEAARKASRPITVVQLVAAACLLGVAVAASPWLLSAFDWVRALVPSMGVAAVAGSETAAPISWIALLAVVSFVVFAPIAAYVALADD